MRSGAFTVLVLGTSVVGCSPLLGLTDPTPGDGGPGGEAGPPIDAPPPCVTAAQFQLAPGTPVDVGGTGTAFVVADFDGAPGLDAAVAVGDGIQILRGDGTGRFTAGLKIALAGADAVATEDFDSDGDFDLVAWDSGGTAIAAFRQNRNATPSVFLAAQALTGPFTALEAALPGQLDGQLVADLLVRDASGARNFLSQLGNPGTFSRSATVIGNVAAGDALIAVGQLDGAARDDAAFVSASGEVKLAFNAPSYTPAAVVATGARGRCVGFGKLDGGDTVDLLVGTDAGGVIYRGSGAAFAQAPGIFPAITGPTMQLIDLNGDDRADALLATRIVYQCAPATAGGTGVFTQIQPIDPGVATLAVDVTGDGKPDLLRLTGAQLEVRVQ